jgi:hypothetical protein
MCANARPLALRVGQFSISRSTEVSRMSKWMAVSSGRVKTRHLDLACPPQAPKKLNIFFLINKIR